MFGANPFGAAVFGDVGNRDTRLTTSAQVADALSVVVRTAISLASALGITDESTSSPPATRVTLDTYASFLDAVHCGYGQFFSTIADIVDTCSVSPNTTVSLTTNTVFSDVATLEPVLTSIQLGADANITDSAWVEFYLCSQCAIQDFVTVTLATVLQLTTAAVLQDTPTIAKIRTRSLLTASTTFLDTVQVRAISAGFTTYPGHDQYVYDADRRDYESLSAIRDYLLTPPDNDYDSLLTAKDYDIYYYYAAGSAMTAKTLSNKDPGETVPVKFFFDNIVASVDTADALEISLDVGEVDPDMAAMLVGTPVVDGALVVQMVQGGLAGNQYKLRCTIRSNSEVYIATALLPVEVD
jgi:hypothetical protein